MRSPHRRSSSPEELASGPRWRSELAARTSPEWNGLQHFVDLVRTPPSGTWERRRADRFALAEDWLGEPPQHDDPQAHLVARYLGGFGPASAGDVASFAMLPVTAIRAALERVAPKRFRDERGTELFDVPRAPLPHPDTGGAGALPPHLGRDAARARAPHAAAPRAPPAAGVRHEDAALGRDVPRRRPGRGRVAPRRRANRASSPSSGSHGRRAPRSTTRPEASPRSTPEAATALAISTATAATAPAATARCRRP